MNCDKNLDKITKISSKFVYDNEIDIVKCYSTYCELKEEPLLNR